jgi:2-polyprenyl-3-methyl-5-hydroxy-6-metoxy-1,4-benzoquinol methylase
MTSDPQCLFDNVPQDEHAFKRWLSHNASDVLQAIGVTEGQTLLDYGCNQGVFAIPAARLVGETGKVYGVDVNAEALTELRQAASEIKEPVNVETVLIEDKQNPLRWLTEQVDVILLYDVLQVIDDQRALLHDLHKALKADGLLSMFPMHVGVEPMIVLAEQEDLFTLRDRHAMLLNFEPMKRTHRPKEAS